MTSVEVVAKLPGAVETPTGSDDEDDVWLEDGSESVVLEVVQVVMVLVPKVVEAVERTFFSAILLWINSFMMACWSCSLVFK